jgi:hypothetical protein
MLLVAPSVLLMLLNSIQPTELEIHYHLNDGSHSADAFAYNESETELLALIKESARILNIGIDVETEALAEGGIKRILKFIGVKQILREVLVATLVAYLTGYFTKDKEKEQLTNENIIRQNELLTALIDHFNGEHSKITRGNLDEHVDEAANILAQSHSTNSRRSKYYTAVNKINNVEKVGYKSSICQSSSIPEIIIERSDFPKFYISSEYTVSVADDFASIQLVSPVLISRRKIKWKGIYDQKIINFTLSDASFVREISTKKVKFVSGSVLECKLEYLRLYNENGDMSMVGHDVPLVISCKDDAGVYYTENGKLYLKQYKQGERTHVKKESSQTQLDLF